MMWRRAGVRLWPVFRLITFALLVSASGAVAEDFREVIGRPLRIKLINFDQLSIAAFYGSTNSDIVDTSFTTERLEEFDLIFVLVGTNQENHKLFSELFGISLANLEKVASGDEIFLAERFYPLLAAQLRIAFISREDFLLSDLTCRSASLLEAALATDFQDAGRILAFSC